MWGAAGAGGGLALAPNARQQQCIESGIQRWAVGRVCVKHGLMVPGVDVGTDVRMVNIVDVGVGTRVLGAQTVGPALGEGSCRWKAGLGKHVASPQGSIRRIERHRAGGDARVERDRDSREARAVLGCKSVVPSRAALTV